MRIRNRPEATDRSVETPDYFVTEAWDMRRGDGQVVVWCLGLILFGAWLHAMWVNRSFQEPTEAEIASQVEASVDYWIGHPSCDVQIISKVVKDDQCLAGMPLTDRDRHKLLIRVFVNSP
jgi:hypothetical protein